MSPALPILAACLLTGQAALAQCPTSSDLEAGIRIDFLDGVEEVYTGKPDLVQAVGYVDGTRSYFYTLVKGYHVSFLNDLGEGGGGTRTFYVFPVPFEDLVVPDSAEVAPVTYEVEVNSGAEFFTETQDISYVGTAELRFGDCAYDARMSVIRYDVDGYLTENGVAYLPALGISVVTYYADGESREDFAFGAISVER